MGTIAENHEAWTHYDWSQGGDEWSECWGSTESLWWTTVFPRVGRFLPARRILEIAPGFGRITHYLKDLCEELVVVDLTERCIDACRKRFSTSSHITYHVNDGRSLDAIPDDSIDFVFSYDSLVHADGDVVASYIAQLGRKLRRGGAGFFHHSNLGAYRDPATGALSVENPHWRADTMAADDLIRFCDAAGLVCLSQELVAWGGDVLNDCFSTFTVRGSAFERPYQRVENANFMEEAARAQMLSRVYALGVPTRRDPELASLDSNAGPDGMLARLRGFTSVR
jgi:SAM-dependent methyltransferase